MNQAFYFVSSVSSNAVRLAETSLELLVRRAVPQRMGLKFHVESSVPRLLAKLRSRPADALVIDARGEEGPIEESRALRLLDELLGSAKLAGPLGRQQIWLAIDPSERGARLAFEAGRCRINGAIASPTPDGIFAQVVDCVAQSLARRSRGKVAICLAGGGI